jgi:hypothetical protein
LAHFSWKKQKFYVLSHIQDVFVLTRQRGPENNIKDNMKPSNTPTALITNCSCVFLQLNSSLPNVASGMPVQVIDSPSSKEEIEDELGVLVVRASRAF